MQECYLAYLKREKMGKVEREVENFNAKWGKVSADQVFTAIHDQCIQYQDMAQAIVTDYADMMSSLKSHMIADKHFQERMQRASDAASRVTAHVRSSMQ